LTNIHFRQLHDPTSKTFSYLIGCVETSRAVMIDPVIGQVPLYLGILRELGLGLDWVLETHLHGEHISAADTLRECTCARVAASQQAGIEEVDRQLIDRDTLRIGLLDIDVLATPGHTPGCLTYRWADRLFTGDSLLIGGCGRVGEPGGDGAALFDSVTRRLFCLADETLVYPGHCLCGRRVSCIGEERERNPCFHGVSRDGFVSALASEANELPVATPSAIAANRRCGRITETESEDRHLGVGEGFFS
jgi:glyoxylase-like metal-dependent hydrolase (beta-lactamase superfamily II)